MCSSEYSKVHQGILGFAWCCKLTGSLLPRLNPIKHLWNEQLQIAKSTLTTKKYFKNTIKDIAIVSFSFLGVVIYYSVYQHKTKLYQHKSHIRHQSRMNLHLLSHLMAAPNCINADCVGA